MRSLEPAISISYAIRASHVLSPARGLHSHQHAMAYFGSTARLCSYRQACTTKRPCCSFAGSGYTPTVLVVWNPTASSILVTANVLGPHQFDPSPFNSSVG